jgi:hypothetical protein
MKNALKYSLILLTGFSVLGLNSCAPRDEMRHQVAARISSPAWMVKRDVATDHFNLVAFERMHEREAVATLYIEGDGKAHSTKARPLFNATPANPVALHLASKDKAINLAYLSRPCQYTEEFQKGANDPQYKICGEEYWNGGQYKNEVFAGYNQTLDGIKKRYGVTGFHLVGYDGGATIAAALAAGRKDVLSLRSVAGEFNLPTLSPHMGTLRFVPQHHYIGGADTVNPPAGLHAYLQALGENDCAEYTLIQEAAHEKGWVDKWPELLKSGLPSCSPPPQPAFEPIMKPKPPYYPRNLGDMKK